MAADPQLLAQLMAEGAAAAKRGAFAEAARAFERAAALAPELAAAQVNLGNVLARLGRGAEAVAALERAVALDPAAALARYNLGNVLADLGQLEAAARAFRAALDQDPRFVAARNNLGSALLRQAAHAEALECFRAVVAAEPAFPHAQYNVGVTLGALGRADEAHAAYQRAHAQDPGDLLTLNNLCLSALRRGEAEQALALCERYLALSPANRKPLAYKAVALIELGWREAAAELLDFARMIMRRPIAAPVGYGSVAEFNADLAAFAERHPSLAFEPPDKSTVGGSQTGELLLAPGAVTSALSTLIRAAVPDYVARLRATLPEHPYTQGLPERWRLATWAVVLRDAGHQGPHFHPDGYISGVYYARLPATMRGGDDHAGWLEFGRTGDAIGNREDPLIELVRPEEGLLLLFPSYFYHRTIPFAGAEPRISVAFDVLPGA
jgi:tetratricopeptide (TPR) repeat protein